MDFSLLLLYPYRELSQISALAYIEIQDLSGSHIQTKVALKRRGSAMVALPDIAYGNLPPYRLYEVYAIGKCINFYAKYLTVYNPLSPLRSENVITSGNGKQKMRPKQSLKNPPPAFLSIQIKTHILCMKK